MYIRFSKVTMPTNPNINPNDYLAEDPLVLPWGKIVKLLRGQVPLPIAMVLATILKITKWFGGGSPINAAARDSVTIPRTQIPILGKKAIDAVQTQLPDFEFLAFARRDSVGLRQEYAGLGLHSNQRILAICSWQHHLMVLPADKMADERDKSTESLSIDLVSFDRDRPIVTMCIPREHMGATDLFDASLGDIVARSNETRLEDVLAEHVTRIEGKGVDYLNPDTAVPRAKQYGYRIRDFFINLGLLRPITEKELRKMQKQEEKHAERFGKYTVLDSVLLGDGQ
jgi:hypothetical protein